MVQRLQPDLACLQEFDQAAEEAFLRNLEGYRCVAVLRNEQLPPKETPTQRDSNSCFESKNRSGHLPMELDVCLRPKLEDRPP
eukprot:g4159.t1